MHVNKKRKFPAQKCNSLYDIWLCMTWRVMSHTYGWAMYSSILITNQLIVLEIYFYVQIRVVFMWKDNICIYLWKTVTRWTGSAKWDKKNEWQANDSQCQSVWMSEIRLYGKHIGCSKVNTTVKENWTRASKLSKNISLDTVIKMGNKLGECTEIQQIQLIHRSLIWI